LVEEGSLGEERLSKLITLFLGFFHRGFRETRVGQRKLPNLQDDLHRLGILMGCVKQWLENAYGFGKDQKRMRYLLEQFGRLVVAAIDAQILSDDLLEDALVILPMLVDKFPALADDHYYAALEKISLSGTDWTDKLIAAVLSPLHHFDWDETTSSHAYSSFAAQYLSASRLSGRLWDKDYQRLRDGVDIGRLTDMLLENPVWEKMDDEGRLWLISHIIDTARHGRTTIDLTGNGSDGEKNYMTVLSLLLSSVAVEVGQRMEVEDVSMEPDSDSEDEFRSTRTKRREPLPTFVKTQIQSLLQQSSVGSMLSNTRSTDPEAGILAGFALTLLLVFPARREDIRMWICLAETVDGVSAVRFFWSAVKNSSLFGEVKKDLKVAVDRMKLPAISRETEEEWNLIFLFLEVYHFLLSVSDDSEFLAPETGPNRKLRQLPLEDVKELTLFLKNLAFALYYYTGEIMGEDKTKDTGGEVFFNPPESRRGWDVKQYRNAVTAVLRMIYIRECVVSV
jgi:ubiquitin-protein ligase E3 C